MARSKKKKEENLSVRQRQSRQFKREKELQIRRQNFVRRAKVAAAVFSGVFLVFFGFWVWKTDAINRAVGEVSNQVYNITVQTGYSVQNLYLEGRKRTPMEEIEKALDVSRNSPILKLSLEEMRSRLEKIESVKHAAVERSLPDSLYVRIVEREPVALWQYQGKISLVDDNGVVMTGLDMAPYKTLPLIVGENAPKHVNSILEILSSEPSLLKLFVAAVWVGDRRWNIKIKPKENAVDENDNIEVQLPEENALVAWKQLAELQKKQQILEREIKVLDLRIDGRLFIKLPDDKTEKKSVNAKDI